MEESQINFQFDKKTNKFLIDLTDSHVEFEINKITSDKLIANLDDAVIFKVDDNKNLAVYSENDKINISYSQNDFKIQEFSIKFYDIKDFVFNLNIAIVLFDNKPSIKLQAIDCRFLKFENNTLKIVCDSPTAKIEIFDKDQFSALKAAIAPDDTPTPPMSMLTVTEAFVLPGSRGPEFSIGLFDSYDEIDHTRPRPIRLGVPVISTVPAFSYDLNEQDQYYYNEGIGPDSRKIYVRAVCNQEIPDQSVKLLIYLPNGVDTVTDPDFVNLTKISQSGENSVYQGEYVFYVEDGYYSIDGFVYFNIYTDIVQQVSLSMEIDEDPTTYQNFTLPTTEIELF
jgi:hypothetical protein